MSFRFRTLPSLLALPLVACVVPANNPPPYYGGSPPPAASPAVVDPPAGEPPAIATDDSLLAFTGDGWTFYGNGRSQPAVRGDQLELIPDDAYSAASVAFWRSEIRGRYVLELDYSTWDDDGGPVDHSADGIAVMLLRSEDAYRRGQAPPAGGARGVINDGTGYTVHLATYGRREIYLADGEGRVLVRRPLDAAYTDGRFARLRIEVSEASIDVAVDGVHQLRWSGTLDHRHGGIAIAAGTGAADSAHVIRDVRLTPADREPGEANLIVNGDFEQTVIERGGWQVHHAVPGWRTVAGPGIELQNHVAGSPARGDHHVELDSHASTAIAQDVAVVPGRRYQLRYHFAARPGTPFADNRLEVRWNGALVDVAQAAGDGHDTRWLERAVEVPAGASRHAVLELRDAGTSNGVGTYVDAVELVELY